MARFTTTALALLALLTGCALHRPEAVSMNTAPAVAAESLHEVKCDSGAVTGRVDSWYYPLNGELVVGFNIVPTVAGTKFGDNFHAELSYRPRGSQTVRKASTDLNFTNPDVLRGSLAMPLREGFPLRVTYRVGIDMITSSNERCWWEKQGSYTYPPPA